MLQVEPFFRFESWGLRTQQTIAHCSAQTRPSRAAETAGRAGWEWWYDPALLRFHRERGSQKRVSVMFVAQHGKRGRREEKRMEHMVSRARNLLNIIESLLNVSRGASNCDWTDLLANSGLICPTSIPAPSTPSSPSFPPGLWESHTRHVHRHFIHCARLRATFSSGDPSVISVLWA